MSEIKALEKLRELACDINGQEIIDHMQLYPSCVFDGIWLDSWHREFDRLANAIQAEVDERFMELPMDADGVPIKPGDIMQFRDDAPVRVDSIGNSKCYVGDFGWFGGNGGFYGKGTLKCCRHVKPRTLEDVLNDCADEISEKRGIAPELNRDTPTRNEIVDKYAAEIRELLRGDAE